MSNSFRYGTAVILMCTFLHGCKHKQKQVSSHVKDHPRQNSTKNTPSSKATHKNTGTELQQKLGLSSREIRDNKLFSFIDDWYGVPYRYGGCQKTGVDCSCFANVLYEQVYRKKIARSAGDIFLACDKIGLEDAEEGDFLFFKIRGNSITHVGIYIRKKFFVHSSTSKGVMISSVDEAYYKKYFYCAGRHKNV